MPAILLAAFLPPASAADEDRLGNIELTPHVAYRLGGSFETEGGAELELDDGGGWGITANIRASGKTQWEIYYGRQGSEFESGGLFTSDPVLDVDIDYFHGGGTYVGQRGNYNPYLALTIGAARFAPRDPELDDEIFFSVSLGAGLRIAAGERMAFRLEGRFFTSLIDSDSSLFCESGGTTNVCILTGSGSTLTQWQASAGLTLKF